MPGTYIPAVPSQFFDANGAPAASHQLFTYEAGTTTKLATYTDAAQTTANTNPIILDSAGRATIFLAPADSYKFVLASATDTDPPASPLWTRDVISSLPDSGSADVIGTFNGAAAAGSVVYLNSSGLWDEADADTISASRFAYAIGITLEATVSAIATVRVAGKVTGLAGLSAGSVYYVSSTAGGLTLTKPTTTSPRIVGVADTATSLVLTPSIPFDDVVLNIASFGFSAGQANVGTALTDLTSYHVTLPGGLLSAAGHSVVVEGVFTLANNANIKTAEILVGSGTSRVILSTAAAVANHVVPFRLVIRYRTSTTGAISGLAHVGAASAGAPTAYLTNATVGTVDWTVSQVLKIQAQSDTASNDISLTDYNVMVWRGPGTLV